MKQLMHGTKIINKAIKFIIFAGSLLLLSGCWDRIEMDELAIVTTAAIDKSEDDQVEVSLEVFIPKSMSGGSESGGGSSSAGATMIMTNSGINIADAVSKLQSEFPRSIFWGSCKVFIFSEDIAKDGLQNHLDFLLRDPKPRERAYIFISKGTAKQIIALSTILKNYSSESIKKMADKGYGMKVTLLNLDEMLTEKDQAAAIPLLTINKQNTGSKKSSQLPKINGVAVFRKDQMIGTISRSTTRGLMWLRGEIKDYTINIKPENEKGEVAVMPVSTDINLIPRIQDGEWTMMIHIKTNGITVQNNTQLDLNDPKSLRKTEEAYREKIEDRVSSAIKEAQQMKADIMQLGDKFHKKYPKEWNKVKDHWEEVYPEVRTTFMINAQISGQGYINQSIQSKEQ